MVSTATAEMSSSTFAGAPSRGTVSVCITASGCAFLHEQRLLRDQHMPLVIHEQRPRLHGCDRAEVAPFWSSASTPVLLVTNSDPSGLNAIADTSLSLPPAPAIDLPEKP